VDDAWAAQQAQTARLCGNGYTCTVDTLHPCLLGEGDYGTEWGQPIGYCWHYKTVSPSGVVNEGITGQISNAPYCPNRPGGWVWPPHNLGNRQFQDRCQLTRTAIIPCDHCSGQLRPESDATFQGDQGYSGGDGGPTFGMNYDSVYGR